MNAQAFYKAQYEQLFSQYTKYQGIAFLSVDQRLREQVHRHSERAFLHLEDRTVSYREFGASVDRCTALLEGLDLTGVQRIALIMFNGLDLLAMMFAGSRLNRAVGVIDPLYRDQFLANALKAMSPDLVIVDDRHEVQNARDFLGIRAFTLLPDLTTHPGPAPHATTGSAQHPTTRATDDFLNLLTSGTTGVMKAARISHRRWLSIGEGWCSVMGIGPEDVFYCMLPLNHGAASMTILSTALNAGASIVLREKFSASKFWQDVHRYGITSCQYVGEICRYLLNQPPNRLEQGHRLVRLMGAGLAPELWPQVLARFGIRNIYEGWSQTELNGALMLINLDNKPGSCGLVVDDRRFPLRLARFDVERGALMKDDAGRHMPCLPGEVGEALGRLPDDERDCLRFEGYLSDEATENAIMHDVFEPGDRWWRTRDLLRFDEEGYGYFVDRVADSFRWKGENVSTLELEAVIGTLPYIRDCAVYGIKLEGQEGKAGMVAVVPDSGQRFDLDRFLDDLMARLPPYAIPQAVRVCREIPLTSSYKLIKNRLRDEALDTTAHGDPLYVLDGGRFQSIGQ